MAPREASSGQPAVVEVLRFPNVLEAVRRDVERALVEIWEGASAEHAALGPAVAKPLEAARELCLRGGKRLRAGLVATGYIVGGGGVGPGGRDVRPCVGVC